MMVQEHHLLTAFVQRVRRGLTLRRLLQSGIVLLTVCLTVLLLGAGGAVYCSLRASRCSPVQSPRSWYPRIPGSVCRAAGAPSGLSASGAHEHRGDLP